MTAPLSIIPITGLGEIGRDASLGPLIAAAAAGQGSALQADDCLVVTQKIVSKAEGAIVPLDHGDLAARAELIERESVRILRRRDELVIAETRHGFICANAGVDLSNVDEGYAALLPKDGDRSAHRIRDAIRGPGGPTVAVIISDTFGRPWRLGLTDVAIGVAGIAAVVDLRGEPDDRGQTLRVTEVAIADEITSAAELVMGKSRGVPAAIVRGLDGAWFRDGSVQELVRPPHEDLFR